MRTCRRVDFGVPADHRVRLKESEMRATYLDLERELKKKQTVQHKICGNWCARYSHQRICTGIGEIGTKMTSVKQLEY